MILKVWWRSQINRELTTIQNAKFLNTHKYKVTRNRVEGDSNQTEADKGSEILFEQLLGIVSIRSILETLQKEIYWWYWVKYIWKTLL